MPVPDLRRGSSEKKLPIKMFSRQRNHSSNGESTLNHPGLPSPGTRIISVLWNKAKSKDQDAITVDIEESSGDFTTMEGASPPLDEAMADFLDFETISVDEGSTSEDALRVKIVKDQLKIDLLELMRSNGGNVRVLEEIESDTATPESVDQAFGSAQQMEKNVAFLWCAFMKRPDLLMKLQELGADVDYCEPQEGFSALHLSAFSGCAVCVKHLLAAGIAADYALKNYTALHCAAFGNSVGTAQLLVGAGARADTVGLRGDAVVGTAIHSAVKANAVECVQLLARFTSDINATEPTGAAVAHVAADLGHLECLAAILSAPGVDVDVKTREKRNTPLHLAADGGYAGCLAALLASGANADATNAKGQTALHLAAKTQSVECVEMLLKGRCNPNVVDNDLRTPLHCAMSRQPLALEVSELLIESWRGQVNAADNSGYTPLHIASSNKLSQCVDLLLVNNADVTARTKGGLTALNLIVKKTPGCLATFSDMLDKAISTHEPENSKQEVELKLNFRCLLPRVRGRNEISFLNTFVEEGHKDILEHPLCEAFLYLKWQKVRKYFFWRLVFCGFFVLWLTAYVMAALAHSCYNEGRNITASAENSTCDNGLELLIKDNLALVDVHWYFLLVFTLVETIRKLYCVGSYPTWRTYFSDYDNYLEWFVIGSVLAMSCVYHGQTYPWQKYVGAFSVLTAWTNLMFMVGQLPMLGSYVAMYTKVQREFAKLLLAYVCLLVGFTVSFCVIFPAHGEFANPVISFVNILVMMTGQVSVDPLVNALKENMDDWWYVSAFVIYILFLLMVTIVLMNLLVGIAVNDIQGLKKTAGLSKLVQQTQLISYMEQAMFNKRLPAYVLKVLSSTSLFAYRVVLEVKPLNPGETRLPKEILAAAYELAKSVRHASRGKGSPTVRRNFDGKLRLAFLPKGLTYKFGRQSSADSMRSEGDENALTLMKLAGEVREMKDMMRKLVEALVKKT